MSEVVQASILAFLLPFIIILLKHRKFKKTFTRYKLPHGYFVTVQRRAALGLVILSALRNAAKDAAFDDQLQPAAARPVGVDPDCQKRRLGTPPFLMYFSQKY
jgi:hypothetical protein